MFAASLPVMLGLGAGSVEFVMATQKQVALQGLTDTTAIAIARQMTVSTLSPGTVQALIRAFVEPFEAQYGPVVVQSTPATDAGTVRVAATLRLESTFSIFSRLAGVESVAASSTAKVGGSSKLCLISIDEARANEDMAGQKMFISKDTNGLKLAEGARISAPGCTLHTNFRTREAFIIETQAKVTADLLCASGGVRNLGGSVDAEIVTDCPRVPNPLENRSPTRINRKCVASEYRVWEFREGTHTLQPGRYCGDILISGTAKVRFNSGEYAIQGKLLVDGDSELVGDGVALYFYGGLRNVRPSYFRFTGNALIDLTAPEEGAMAGILIWEGINGAVVDLNRNGKDPEGSNFHRISSARARRLTGTIYLPAGQLLIDAPVVVADRSDYTLLVVNRLELARGPNLVLNSNYAKSRVPVPPGLGPIGVKEVRLIK